MTGFEATLAIEIEADADTVWSALTDPKQVAEYFFGSEVKSTWEPGSPITWSGEWQGKPYEDKGVVVAADRPKHLVVTHYSPLSGAPDQPENYHRLTYDLTEVDGGTRVDFVQDNNPTKDAAAHSADNWQAMLQGLKKTVEQS